MKSKFDQVFHYPAELLALLIDGIPRLCRSKRSVVEFFRSAGVGEAILRTWDRKISTDPDSVRKHEIARDVLQKINAAGDQGLTTRREVLKRIVEWEDFGTCWPSDQGAARGFVSQVRDSIGRKDAFTRMDLERERERSERLREEQLKNQERQRDLDDRAAIQTELASLFGEKDPWRRGKRLEAVLNRLFENFGVQVREAFTIRGDEAEGIVEQIDGLVVIRSHLYIVEVKWHKEPLGLPEISTTLVKAFTRAEARALIVSATGFTAPAVAECKRAISQKIVVLAELREVVVLLERRADLELWLADKIVAAEIDREPLRLIA